jgi:hypothetical protein
VLPAPNVRAPKALKLVVSAIRRNELYVFTHVRPEWRLELEHVERPI